MTAHFIDPYLDTINDIVASGAENEAALVGQVFDALHLVQSRRSKKIIPAMEPTRMEERPSFIPALLLSWTRSGAEACHA